MMRTTRKDVIFDAPFVLAGFDRALPAGTYTVDTDEELLEEMSFPATLRVSTRLHARARPGVTQVHDIDPADLDAALARDRALSSAQGTGSGVVTGTPDASRAKTDPQTFDRASDEEPFTQPR
jgi:hypothetical protein